MKTQVTLLAFCLLGASLVNGQSTTNTNSSGSTNSTTGTNSSGTMNNSTSPSSTSPSNGSTMSNGTTNSSGSGSMNSSGTMSNGSSTTNGSATPTYGTGSSTNSSTSGTYNATTRPDRSNADYKNFVFGIYAGLNSTKFKGESINTGGKLSGRLGYQAGFFVRGGGRLYGQLGAEYFASSSNYFVAGSGQTAKNIQSQIDIQYVQIPVYIGYKLVESDRGISAVRLQVGLEYANRINSNSGDFNLNKSEIKSGTFNGLGQLGFDAGPLFLDLTYHHGFNNAINSTNVGFAGSQRRILSASVGFKF